MGDLSLYSFHGMGACDFLAIALPVAYLAMIGLIAYARGGRRRRRRDG